MTAIVLNMKGLGLARKFTWVRGRRLYRIMSLCCALAFCMYGYDAGVLGGVQETDAFLSAMGYPTGAYTIPLISSSYTLAAFVCSVMVTFVGMPLGRRGCILLGNLLVCIGAALQASSYSVAQICVARVICGFGIGFISCSVPSYMAEMSIISKERGPEVCVQCIWLIWGVAAAYWIDFGFTRLSSQISWRFPIGFQAFFAIVSGLGMLCLPDTPRWYFARGRYEEGDEVICRLHDAPIDDPAVQKMRKEIVDSIELEEEEENKFKLISLIWDRTPLRAGLRIRIAFLVLSLQQMMGINLSVYYSTIIFSQVGLTPFLSQILAAAMNTVFAIGTIPTPWLIERWGRKPIMLWSAVGLLFCMIVFVILIGVPNPGVSMQWGSVGILFVYNFLMGFGWMGVPWIYGPEIAPLKLRHAAASATCTGEWLFSFLVVFGGGTALRTVGWKIWLWMLLSCAVTIPFVWFMCPETTGKTLEEIDLIFAKPGAEHLVHLNDVGNAADVEREKDYASYKEKV